MLATSLNAANAWLILVSSAVIIWLFIWGGIKMWHVHQAGVLREQLSPMLNDIKMEQSRQATVIADIHHEVNLNSGSSIKDAVLAIRSSQSVTNSTLLDLSTKTDRIDKGLERHLGLHDGMELMNREGA